MKKSITLFFLAFLAFSLKAQNTTPEDMRMIMQGPRDEGGYWQSLGLNMTTGTNRFSGVDGFYQLISCNGIETILIKLVNYNPYAVKAGWKDLMVNKDGQQLSGSTVQDSVTIKAGGQIEGDCTGKNPQLMLKLSDFGTDKINFKYLITSGFDFVVIHSSVGNDINKIKE